MHKFFKYDLESSGLFENKKFFDIVFGKFQVKATGSSKLFLKRSYRGQKS